MFLHGTAWHLMHETCHLLSMLTVSVEYQKYRVWYLNCQCGFSIRVTFVLQLHLILTFHFKLAFYVKHALNLPWTFLFLLIHPFYKKTTHKWVEWMASL